MSYAATVYKVMIASPGDINGERRIVREVIADWNSAHSETRGIVLMPIGWETHSVPDMGGRPQEIINKQNQSAIENQATQQHETSIPSQNPPIPEITQAPIPTETI